MNGAGKLGLVMVFIGIVLATLLKIGVLISTQLLNTPYVSLSFYPILSLLFVILGVGILFFSVVHSGVLTLVVLIIAAIVVIYIYATIFGWSLIGISNPLGSFGGL